MLNLLVNRPGTVIATLGNPRRGIEQQSLVDDETIDAQYEGSSFKNEDEEEEEEEVAGNPEWYLQQL